MAANVYSFPLGQAAAEQPVWMVFYSAPYSLKKKLRGRDGIANRADIEIHLPLPKDPGYMIAHQYGVGNDNPIQPLIGIANILNSSRSGKNYGEGSANLAARMGAASMAYYEKFFATSTYRRFSNLTELTMVSEGRKQYTFNYVFVPKSQAESVQVEDICATFRKTSYPTLASNLPERTFPQNLWWFTAYPGNNGAGNVSDQFLGEPLPCVLTTVMVKRNDSADPITRFLPNGNSALTLLSLKFEEFETGTYDFDKNAVRSKSEIATDYL